MTMPASDLFPDYSRELSIEEARNPVSLSIHSWVVRTPDDIIVIDTGTGNGRDRAHNAFFHNLNTPYLENFLATGIKPEDVTMVLITHVHIDHVGWNTVQHDNRWVPMFPNARYICSEKELTLIKNSDHYQSLWLDSLLPVIEAGLLETIDVAAQPVFADCIKYMPTPGHSPDHASLILSSGGESAFFAGDIMHSPLQFEHPEWNSVFCGDPRQAEKSRRQGIAWCLENDALWFSSHFSGESCGKVRGDKTGKFHWIEAGGQ
ncbi:MBL fold metallo-hydrolase [Pectobacterium cacticida]|uniref:MBL fold metallo-hydrolase n=1 Tax=Pectobacterium cacticida TaxID=69221 RepID=UPI002FF10ED9